MLIKPPLGITPRYIWDQMRLDQVTMAIFGFINTGSQIPIEWVEEYNELIKRKKMREHVNRDSLS